MGLSSSKSRTTTSSSQTGQETSSGTQMPVTPAWLEQAAMEYVGRIGAFGENDPMSFVAAASPLQQMAWQNAGRLSGWQGQARTAAELALAGAGRGANLAGAVPAAQTFAYQAPPLGDAALVSGEGYAAPILGAPQAYAAARTGAPIGAGSQSFTSAPTARATIAPTADAPAASLLDGLAAYRSPYTRQVVDASLAEYDQGVARQQARLAADGARSGAFGGSRFGIAEGHLSADAARGRAATAAGLLDQGFRAAAELAQSDAALRQQAGLANAGHALQRAQAQAGLDQETNLFEAAARNAAGQFGAEAANRAGLADADATNRFALDQAARADAAAQYAAAAANQHALARAGLQADAARFGADAVNRSAELNAGARNQLALAQAQLAAQAARDDAAARQQASLFNSGLGADLARFDADQRDAAATRELQAAGLLGDLARDYGAGTRADLGALAALGDQQRGIEQAYAMAPLAQLEAIGRLSGMTPYDILVGRALTGTSSSSATGNGTSSTTQSPSLFSQLLDAGQLIARF